MLAELVNASPRAGIIFEYPLGQLVRDLEPVMAYGRAHRSLRAIIGGAADAAASNDGVYYNRPKVGPLTRFPTQERFHTIVRGVVEASLAKRDLDVIGSKTPGSAGSTDPEMLEPYFPRISYLYSMRNPLDTINSMLNRRNLTRLGADSWPWGDVTASIQEYRENVLVLLSHAAAYPDECFVVKYEDLVADLDPTAQRVGDFLGLEFDYGAASPLNENGYLRRKPGHTKLVLTADERAAIMDAFGGAIAAWNDKPLTGPAPSAAAALTDCVDRMRLDTKYSYAGIGGVRNFLGLGWSTLQEDGVWSNAKRADLFCTVEQDGDYVLFAETSFYVPDPRPRLGITLDVDGTEAFRGTFIASSAQELDATAGGLRVYSGDGRKGLVCGPLRLQANRAHRLTFTIDDPRSPLEFGYSSDGRKVGVMLHSLLLTRA